MFEDVLKIKNVMGGILGVKAIIQNSGDTSLDSVAWTISVKGGTLGMVNRTRSGTISSLPAGKSRFALCLPIIGMGSIEVTVTLTMPSMSVIKKVRQGIVLGSMCLLTP